MASRTRGGPPASASAVIPTQNTACSQLRGFSVSLVLREATTCPIRASCQSARRAAASIGALVGCACTPAGASAVDAINAIAVASSRKVIVQSIADRSIEKSQLRLFRDLIVTVLLVLLTRNRRRRGYHTSPGWSHS